jgi:GH15 family glucan-1,4-alpha-glucosidase
MDQLRRTRDEIRADVLDKGGDGRGVFVQTYGGSALDASLLMIPLVGFLPADDPRVVATVDAIQRELTHDGFVHRYDPSVVDDGVGGPEGTFTMCTFWMVDVLVLMGRHAEAEALFERACSLRNDVGLLSEMWDPADGRQLGNFPQAFSHTALATSAMALARHDTPGQQTWRRS